MYELTSNKADDTPLEALTKMNIKIKPGRQNIP